MTEEQLWEIHLRAKAAAEGPWFIGYWSGRCNDPSHVPFHPGAPHCKYEYKKVTDNEHFETAVSSNAENVELIKRGEVDKATAQFIAHSRQDVPDLIAEIRRLHEILDKCYQNLISAGTDKDGMRLVIDHVIEEIVASRLKK